MSSNVADILGLIGGAIMVAAFGYSNVAARMSLTLFNLLNLVGAALMIASLSVHFNLAAMLLEIVWAAIALFGLVKALAAKRAA